MDFKKEIGGIIGKQLKDIKINLEVPSSSEFGDFSLPCFSIAEKFRENPAETAKELAAKLVKTKAIEKIEAKGPYVNFFINKQILVESVLNRILKEKDCYGSGKTNKKIIVMEILL